MEELSTWQSGLKNFRVFFSSKPLLNSFYSKREVPWQISSKVFRAKLLESSAGLEQVEEVLVRAAVSGGLSETLRPQQQPRSTQLLCFGLFRSTLFSHKMFPSDFKLYHLQLHPDSSIGNLTMRIRNAYVLAFWFWWQDTKIQIKGYKLAT